MRLIGLLLLLAVLVVGYRTLTVPIRPPETAVFVAPQPSMPEVIPPREIAAPADNALTNDTSLRSQGGACRSTSNGRLEDYPVFGGSDLVQVDYWTAEQPERSVLLPGGQWSRPPGMGGTFWVWVGCTFDQAREQVELAMGRRTSDGANHAGWGDPGLFSPAT